MNPGTLTGNQSIKALLSNWPAAVSVFLAYRLACVGCCMAPFCTLDEVIATYHLPRARFLTDLQQRSMPVRERESADGGPDTHALAPGD